MRYARRIPRKRLEISTANMLALLFLGIFGTCVSGLDNGLALTPPMGWMDWQRFRCEINCEKYPNECISEKLFMRMADLMVSEGYLDAGYEYLIVDDCWSGMDRDENDRLYGDLERFPSGMKALGDYIHSKGLKFGLYGDYGTLTCAGYPGSINHMEIDTQTFAEWGVDYVKLDGCYADINTMEEGYKKYGEFLNKTGRPMVYSCSWPAYMETQGIKADYAKLQKACNLWRNYGDIQDSLATSHSISDWFARHQIRFAGYAKPGSWNDPDMLLIGNYGLTVEQSKMQMTIWSLMAAPLIMSNDLATVPKVFKDILQNKKAIAINQDKQGVQGLRINRSNNIDVWRKPISPSDWSSKESQSYALGFVSRREDGTPYTAKYSMFILGLNDKIYYIAEDIFGGNSYIINKTTGVEVRVPPSGAVFLRLLAVS